MFLDAWPCLTLLKGGSLQRAGVEVSLPESRAEEMIPKAPSLIRTWIRFTSVSPFLCFSLLSYYSSSPGP